MIEASVLEKALANPKKKYRLGIMGGTFDPIHFGHLVTAEQARESLKLGEVIFMPTNNPVRQQGKQVTSPEVRFKMVSRAIKSNLYFSASRLEIDRGGITYTVDTLKEMRKIYPKNVEFYFITGADAVFDILTWKDAPEIAKLAKLIAATRPGFDLDEAAARHEASPTQFDVHYLEIPALAISSTYLRNRVAKGLSIRYLTSNSVVSYIEKHGLYKHDKKH